MYWMSANSFVESSAALSPIDNVETSLDMAQALLISPLLNDSTMFSRDCTMSVGMTLSVIDWLEEVFPVALGSSGIEVRLVLCSFLSLLLDRLVVRCVSLCE